MNMDGSTHSTRSANGISARDSANLTEAVAQPIKDDDLKAGNVMTPASKSPHGLRTGFALSLGGITCLWLILLAIFGSYPTDKGDAHVAQYFYYLEGVLIMVFVGFGYLMTFLKSYSFSAVGLNFVLSAMMMVGTTVCMGFEHDGFGDFIIDVPILVDAAFCAAAGMITYGVVIGFATPTQLVWLLAAQTPLYAAVFYLVIEVIGTFDIGGSITIHAFGAFYGLAASYFLSKSSKTRGGDHPKNGSNYVSDITSMIGTVFLWIYWPSFNAALASADATADKNAGLDEPQHQIYVVCNTIISLLGATVATFVVSALLNDAFDMQHVQNATLAGGVAIGTSSALRIAPAAALGVGIIAGILSTLGFTYASPWVEKKLKISDTCGVLNLHGMPGVLGGIVSAILCAIYYDDNKQIFENSMSTQVGLQFAGLFATVGIALVAGAIMGWLVTTVNVPQVSKQKEGWADDDLYDDSVLWTKVE